jgi:hypothetical protein
MTEQPDSTARTAPFLPAALGGVGTAFAFFVFNGGIRLGFSNHTGLMPVVRRMLDPNYLPGDFSIQMRLYHHRVFATIVAGLTTVFGETGALLLLSVVGLLLLGAGVYYLCRALGLPPLGCLLAGLLVALNVLWAGYGIEENTFVGNREVQPPLFAHALMLFAFAEIIKGRYRLPAFLAGVVLSLHLQIGLTFALLLAPFYLVRLKKFGLKETAVIAGLAILPALPALWHAREMFARGVNSSAFTLDYLLFRMPHHFEPLGTAYVLWVAAHVVILGACYWWLRKANRAEARAVGVLLAVSLMLVALALVHFADWYWLHVKTFVKPQFLRVSPLITVFGTLALVATIYAWADERRARGEPRALRLVYAALALTVVGAVVYQVTKERPEYSFKIQRYAEARTTWVEVCRWVYANGPRDTVYLTPPARDGFTYLTHRSNVVEFKINPDGALLLNEWYERLRDVTGGKLPQGRGGFPLRKPLDAAYAALNESQLLALGAKYGAGYAVLPQASKANFPVLFQNKDFRVIKLTPPTPENNLLDACTPQSRRNLLTKP